MFPNLVALFPDEALALTEYRRQRLPAALIRAQTHGYGGAMQPWESALTGFGSGTALSRPISLSKYAVGKAE